MRLILVSVPDTPNTSQGITGGTVLRWRKASVVLGHMTSNSQPFIHAGGCSLQVQLDSTWQRYVSSCKAKRLTD